MIQSRFKPAAIDCFAGAGGLALGLQLAGFDIRFGFDADADAVATYRQNVDPNAIVSASERLSGADLYRASGLRPGECALVAGGPPCQGFSRQRRGKDRDSRNALVLDFFRLVREVNPEFFIMENVSAIGGRRGQETLAELTVQAELAGFDLHAKVLDAADFGVAQHRRRMFIVGERNDGIGKHFAFPAPTHADGSFATVGQAIADLPSPYVEARKGNWPANHEPDNISDMNRKRISFVPQGGGRDHIPE